MHERYHTLYTTSQHVFSLKNVLVDTCTCERILILSLSGYTQERSNLRPVLERRLGHMYAGFWYMCYMLREGPNYPVRACAKRIKQWVLSVSVSVCQFVIKIGG